MRLTAPESRILTLPPRAVERERTVGANADRTAVIVCHGMGQQVRFHTLGLVVDVLRRTGRVAPSATVAGRLVGFPGRVTLARAEVPLAYPDGRTRDVHVYEAYWAPLTEGRVTTVNVLSFLLRAGWDGARHALRSGFARFMFNRVERFASARWVFLQFVVALAVIASLLLMNAAALAVFSARWIPDLPWSENLSLARGLAADILVFVAGCVIFAIGVALRRIPRVAEMGMYALFAMTIVAGALTGHDLVHLLAGDPNPSSDLFWPSALITWVQGRTLVGLWTIVLVVSVIVRYFAVRYIGDVAAYVSGHRLSKFDQIRDGIRKTVLDAVTAVYRDGGYRSCVLVGHSLGSVAAYDALNAMLVEQQITGVSFSPTAGFLTFGSPLDKTAFVFRTHTHADDDVREALATAVQPLMTDEHQRPRWVNLWSPNDIISGSLDFYDRPADPTWNPVENVRDPAADIPLFAHVQYWRGSLLGQALYEMCVREVIPRSSSAPPGS